MNKKNGYVALCYHYIRPEKKEKPFRRILGNSIDEFYKHIKLLKSNYQVLSPDEVLNFSYDGFSLIGDKYGLFISFDDGLSDHYHIASILAENDIKALFFIPTCILIDLMPANPTIIHYCLARYGIDGFLKAYRHALEEFHLTHTKYILPYKKDSDDPWETIAKIKYIFKYGLSYKNTRRVLLYIHKNLLLRDYPQALEIMHLTKEQISEMLRMGHSIGAHSHSHISVAATNLDNENFRKEILKPKEYLEKSFNVPIVAFSYPFGEKQDCLFSEELINQTKAYKLVFTVEKILNTKETNPLELGRYMPMSTDSEIKLDKIVKTIIDGEGILV
ncbi:MAG: polysaccharide deacetylase family protein [Phycisphaerales bacterium]|jgi:peptidoglycan/xylan/chitin deacetylase (PgdA/CDA1 family)